MNLMDKITGKDEETNETHVSSLIPDRLKKNEKVVILTAEGAEDTEFFYPYYRLNEEGYTVDVVTPRGGKFAAKHGLGLNETLSINQVTPLDYSLVYIPGGKAPEELRKNATVLAFMKEFARSGRPIAAICHGAQVLAAADIITGKRIAAWPAVKYEIENAGGAFVNEALVEDGQFITARKPGDLPRHLYGVIQALKNSRSQNQSMQRKPTAA